MIKKITIKPIDYIDFRQLDKDLCDIPIPTLKELPIEQSMFNLSSIPKHLFLNHINDFMSVVEENKSLVYNAHVSKIMETIKTDLSFVSDWLLI